MGASEPFHVHCPKVGFSEYRSMRLRDDEELPDGEYGFLELYCTDPKCDCRRVIFWVMDPRQSPKPLATFGYGWESPEFYVKWYHGDSSGERMAGLSVEPLGSQSKLTDALFRACEEHLLADPLYVERLKRHYALFKEAIRAKGGQGATLPPSPGTPTRKKRRWKH